MKKVRKKINITDVNLIALSDSSTQWYSIELQSLERINIESLELTHEVEVPETISEFNRFHDLSRDKLVNWLNKNYEKV